MIEITAAGPLLVGGRLRAGWARRPLWRWNPREFAALRKKEWNFFAVRTQHDYLAFCAADLGYLGLVFVQWIENDRVLCDRFLARPFARGVRLPDNPDEEVRFVARGIDLCLARSRLSVTWGDLSAEISIGEAPGITVATGEHGGVYYNLKNPGLPACGRVSIGARTREVDAFATFDWGRGVWPWRTFWNWATASGRLSDNRTVAINLGVPLENALMVDGRLHKLGPVEFVYDRKDFRAPWRLRGDGINLCLTVEHLQRKTLELGLVASRTRQAIGHFSGRVLDLEIESLPGWAEEHRARW